MAATATPSKVKVPRVRQPSPFRPAIKVTVSVHKSTENFHGTAPELSAIISSALGSEYAVRTISRTRNVPGGKAAGPASLMVYVAPRGFEFAKTGERGVRLDAETASILRDIAAQMGLDPNDSASIIAVAKALAQKAATK